MYTEKSFRTLHSLNSCQQRNRFIEPKDLLVVIAWRSHLFPFRTEKLSSIAPMVLPPGWESRSPPTPHNLGSIKQLIGPLSFMHLCESFRKSIDIKKGPSFEGPKNGVDILSRSSSTICAGGLNFSVRNGKRWTAPQ